MALPAAIDFALDRRASPDRMDTAMRHIDGRLRALETQKADVDATLLQLQQVGLQRVNDALQPYYRALQAIVSLGVLFNAGSATAVPIGTGPAVFTLSETDRDRFAYAGFMIAVSRADSRNALVGRTVSYDRAAGALPKAVSDGIAALPAGQQFGARMLLCGATEFHRSHPMVPVFLSFFGLNGGSDRDALWTAAAAL